MIDITRLRKVTEVARLADGHSIAVNGITPA
jgi:hypothetical protein